jgi:predicted ATPase
MEEGGEHWWQAELYRLQGEFQLRMPDTAGNEQAAEEYFQRALALSREQHAKSLELRASLSLSGLWHRRGRNSEARHLLAETYQWFTEGFDTPDLRDARNLLERLSPN